MERPSCWEGLRGVRLRGMGGGSSQQRRGCWRYLNQAELNACDPSTSHHCQVVRKSLPRPERFLPSCKYTVKGSLKSSGKPLVPPTTTILAGGDKGNLALELGQRELPAGWGLLVVPEPGQTQYLGA